MPGGLRVSLRRIVSSRGPGGLSDGSLASLRRLPNGARDNCLTGKIR